MGDTVVVLLSVGLVTTLTLEVVKAVLRKWVLKNPEYDFPAYFYEIGLPFVTFLWSIVFGELGWAEPVSWSWEYLLQWGLGVAAALVLYSNGLKPLKEYRKTQ